MTCPIRPRTFLFFASLTALLYAIVVTAQILGFLKLYFLWLTLPLVVIITAAILWSYLRQTGGFYRLLFPVQDADKNLLEICLWIGGLALTVFLIVIPVVLWPSSRIQAKMDWDVGVYHFPKAIEMAKTGSAWDLSIAYGEYPYGFESLFAFAASLTKSTLLFGSMHALTSLYLLFAFWLLLRRYSGLSGGTAFLIANMILLSGLITIKGNFWWFYRFMIYDVGKNDLFLTASVVAAIFHAPIGPRPNKDLMNLPGMALHTTLAVSTKPNAFLILAPVWAWTVLCLWRRSKPLTGRTFPWRKAISLALLVMPGFLWMPRNIIAQGRLFSPEVLGLQRLSIFNNLLNPYLYLHIPRNLYALLIIFVLACVLTILRKRMDWVLLATFAILFLGFIYTPASGFVGITTEPAKIVWRFAGSLVLFATAIIVMWLAPELGRLYRFICLHKLLQAGGSVVLVSLCLYGIWWNKDFLSVDPANNIIVRDQYLKPVGAHGYWSAYDYIQKNVTNSVVWVENGLPFFAYGPGFTNSLTRQTKPDYYLILQTTWWYEEVDYPSILNDPAWQQEWKLVYEDGEGRVYQRQK